MNINRIVTLSYAKNALRKNSREYKRMKLYSEGLEVFHVLVFTRSNEGYPDLIKDGKLFIYATNARTKFGMLISSFLICRRILRNEQNKKVIVSCQDPFETSIIGVILSFFENVYLHVQIHGDNFGNSYWIRENFFNRFRLFFGKKVLERAYKVRVVSRRIQSALIDVGIPRKKIVVLPIQFDFFPFLEIGRNRKEFVGNGVCTFLYVGRFSKEKNLTMLLHAFGDVYATNPNTTLKIVGSGSKNFFLHKLAQNLKIAGVVTFVDWTEEVEKEFVNADVFTLASDHEGYALVLLEAMAAGLPIVTTNVGCVGDLVQNESEGFVVEPRDVHGFANAMKEFAFNSGMRNEIGQNCYRKSVLLQVTSENYMKKWIDSYKLDAPS